MFRDRKKFARRRWKLPDNSQNVWRRGVVVWCGVVWCGVVWCGVVWCGVVWCGVGRSPTAKNIRVLFEYLRCYISLSFSASL